MAPNDNHTTNELCMQHPSKKAITINVGYHNRPTQLLPREVKGNKVTNDISQQIRFHASKEAARKFFTARKTKQWTVECFDKIDWDHLELALKNKPEGYRVWRSKQNLGILRNMSASRKVCRRAPAGSQEPAKLFWIQNILRTE